MSRMLRWLGRVLRRATGEDPARGSGAPPRSPCPPVVILPDDEYDRWVARHGDDAA